MQDDEFEWDDEKARTNLAKHHLAFEDAKHVFLDPRLLDGLDDTMHYEEDRYICVGLAAGRLIAVVYALRGPRRRLISARRATRREAESYAAQRN